MAKSEATLVIKLKNLATKPLKTIKGGISGLTKALQNAKSKMAGFAKDLKQNISDRFVITAGDIVGALKSIGVAIIDFAKKSAEFDSVKTSFENLAASQGQDADKMLAKMRELSQGTVSDLKLMKQANTALLLGLPVDRFGDMLTIARSASKATGESMEFMLNSIVTGLGRGSKLMLDNLGIVFKLEDAYAEYARSLGKTSAQLTETEKKQAFINKALEVGTANAKKAGGSTLNLKDKMEQLAASSENAEIAIGKKLGPAIATVVTLFNDFVTGFTDFISTKGGVEFFNNIAKAVHGLAIGFKSVGQNLGTTLAGAWESAKALAKGNFKEALQINRMAAKQIAEDNEANQKLLNDKTKALDEELANHKQRQVELDVARAKAKAEKIAAIEEEARIQRQAKAIEDQEQAITDAEMELAIIGATDDQRIALEISRLDRMFAAAKTHEQKMAILQTKHALINQQMELKKTELQKQQNKQRTADQRSTLSTISTLSSSSNKTLAAIGKAAALTQIAIDGPAAVTKALAAFPPPINFAAAAAVGAAVTAQAARVAGVQLAEGGIVQATPGGIQATIGEGGRDEAVIPLDDAGAGGIGTTVNITVNGGLLGDESSAKEFAEAVDKELFRLRQGNESLSFDEGVI